MKKFKKMLLIVMLTMMFFIVFQNVKVFATEKLEVSKAIEEDTTKSVEDDNFVYTYDSKTDDVTVSKKIQVL